MTAVHRPTESKSLEGAVRGTLTTSPPATNTAGCIVLCTLFDDGNIQQEKENLSM